MQGARSADGTSSKKTAERKAHETPDPHEPNVLSLQRVELYLSRSEVSASSGKLKGRRAPSMFCVSGDVRDGPDSDTWIRFNPHRLGAARAPFSLVNIN